MDSVTVLQRVDLLREIGLPDDDMRRWHRLFEAKYSEARQNFLPWPGMDAGHIQNVKRL